MHWRHLTTPAIAVAIALAGCGVADTDDGDSPYEVVLMPTP